MVDLLILVLISGIATAAICRTVAYYDGPFHIFPRFRDWLLPKGLIKPIYQPHSDRDIDQKWLMENIGQIMMNDQSDQGEVEVWRTYHSQYNREFMYSFKGTLYNVLDCPFCLGPYVSVSVSAIMILSVGSFNLIHWLTVSFGSFGLHFLISKYWEK